MMSRKADPRSVPRRSLSPHHPITHLDDEISYGTRRRPGRKMAGGQFPVAPSWLTPICCNNGAFLGLKTWRRHHSRRHNEIAHQRRNLLSSSPTADAESP